MFHHHHGPEHHHRFSGHRRAWPHHLARALARHLASGSFGHEAHDPWGAEAFSGPSQGGPFRGGPFAGGPFDAFGGGAPGGPFGGRGPRGRGGLGRFFAHGDLRLVLLALIAEQPRHGYELIKAVETRVGGAYSPSPGVVYPTLTWLEELGYVTVRPEDGGKKLYEITGEGRAFLDANRATIDALFARMDASGRLHGAAPAPEVLRAMENLRLALRMRLARGPLADDQARAIAGALDAAAQAIERA